MTLPEIKLIYTRQLHNLYSKQDIDSLFSLVAARLLNYSKIDIQLNTKGKISKSEIKNILSVLQRLVTGEPIQYIFGDTEFFHLTIKTDVRALIPRPETEYMVDLIIKDLAGSHNFEVIDLCTGSGCIAIALAKFIHNSQLTATDISQAALDLARSNAELHGIEIQFKLDNLLQPAMSYNKYQCVVSNPPYVRNSEKKLMHKNVLGFEPHNALFVEDSDPLIYYRAIMEFCSNYLLSGGVLYAEINEAFGNETFSIFKNESYRDVAVLKDIHDKDRFIKAVKK